MVDNPPLLEDSERLAWLRLIRTPGIGPARFADLLDVFGDAQSALEGLPELTGRRGTAILPVQAEHAEREMEEAQKLGARFVAVGEPGYPATLCHTDRPPPVLCALVRDLSVGTRPMVAMVGARNASAGGLSLAKSMAAELGGAGMVVVSGLARGVDAAAHVGALKTGTIAFMAGGLAKPYPPEHVDLMHRIVDDGGAVYSEMPLGWTARAQDFPRRNRLVAGSSLGVVVVEAAKRSGSLITARQAGEAGRLVMAVPGFPLDPRSDGPNSLIREGATLVTNAKDVMGELAPLIDQAGNGGDVPSASISRQLFREGDTAAPRYDSNATMSDAIEEALEALMSHSPASADTFIETTGAPASVVRVWLFENDLAGRVVRYPGDLWAWNPDR